MKITIEMYAEVKGKLPMVHEIRNIIEYGFREEAGKFSSIYIIN